MKFSVSLFLFIISSGCLFPVMLNNPGYKITITAPIIQKDAIASIKKTLEEQNYTLADEIVRNGRIFFSYRKDISSAASKIEHPYIVVWISFNKGQVVEQMTFFRIEISNEWDGQEPQLKREMDRTADIIYSELKGRIGQENITIDRRPTGPPF